MFKQKWLLAIVALDGVAILAIAVYLFLNFSSMNLAKGLVLIVLASLVFLSVIALLIYMIRKLSPAKGANKNTLPKS